MPIIDINKHITKEQLQMLENASKLPITYDEDCPELTDEELKKFKRVNKAKQNALNDN